MAQGDFCFRKMPLAVAWRVEGRAGQEPGGPSFGKLLPALENGEDPAPGRAGKGGRDDTTQEV